MLPYSAEKCGQRSKFGIFKVRRQAKRGAALDSSIKRLLQIRLTRRVQKLKRPRASLAAALHERCQCRAPKIRFAHGVRPKSARFHGEEALERGYSVAGGIGWCSAQSMPLSSRRRKNACLNSSGPSSDV